VVVVVCGIVAVLLPGIVESTSAAYRDQAHTKSDPIELALADTSFTAIAAGHASAMVTDDGVVYTAGAAAVPGGGSMTGALLGAGTTADASIPTPVAMPEGVKFVTVSSSSFNMSALADDGVIYSWGDGGRTGTDTGDPVAVPTPVVMPEGVKFTAVSVGRHHSIALGDDGVAYTWGADLGNGLGALGQGQDWKHPENPINRWVPSPVIMPEGVTFTAVSAGEDFSLAIGDNGVIYATGAGERGQLGIGSKVPMVDQFEMIVMPEDTRFTIVAAGSRGAVARTDDGRLYSWGTELGGSGTEWPTPYQLETDASSFVSLDMGGTLNTHNEHALALGDDGVIYTWGATQNGLGGNGIGSQFPFPLPQPVKQPAEGVKFVAAAAGEDYSLGLGDDGVVYAWGKQNHAMGMGSDVMKTVPTSVVMPNNDGVKFVTGQVGAQGKTVSR
jgi:alpha-tubulin suppressor-like RCC1 family protein